MAQSIRATRDIWENLRSKRGPELVKALADELAALHRLYANLERSVQQPAALATPSEHLFALDEAIGFSLTLPTRVDLYASQLFDPQEGFFGLEYTAEGLPFRWTGPQRHFSFALNLDRSAPLAAELEIISMIDERRQRGMTLLVDGASVPFRLTQQGSAYLGRAILPATAPRDTTTLTFVVPATFRPPPPSEDARELGIAFTRLKIRSPEAEADAADALADGADDEFQETASEISPHDGEAEAAGAKAAFVTSAKMSRARPGQRRSRARASA